MDQARAVQAVVGAEVDGHVPAFLRDGCSCRGQVPFGVGDGMEFFGRYIEVITHSRLVWTNEEGGDAGPVTTLTFEEKGGKTLLVMHELYPSKGALDAAGTGAADMMGETFAQLDELLVILGASLGRS